MARLDERIRVAILKLLKDSHPNWVTQEEIYYYLEDNIDFTDKQKSLHNQIRGQIEENWLHDARNLIHSMKRKGEIICPHSEIYGLPDKNNIALEQYKITTTWNDLLILAEEKTENYSIINDEKIKILKSNHNLTSTLFKERIEHFILCHGIIEAGSFHNWVQIEKSFVDLIEDLKRYEYNNGENTSVFIIHKNILENKDFTSLFKEREDKILLAIERKRKIEQERGKKRRTVERETKGSIKRALDKKNNFIVRIGEANKRGTDVFICANCREPVYIKEGVSVRKHFSHTEYKKGMQECSWRSNKEDDGSSKWTIAEKQRKRNILDIKLEKQLMLGYQIFTIGDGLHGFPIDIENWNPSLNKADLEIIEHSNLFDIDDKPGSISRLVEWSKEFNYSTSPSIKINDPKENTNIKFKQNQKEYNLHAKPIQENNLFLLDSPDDSSYSRVRPSSDVNEDEWFNNYAPGQFIGVIQKEKFIHDDDSIRNQILHNLDLFLTIFDTSIPEHQQILEEEFMVNKKYSSNLDFDVLISEPIESHPKTPDLIRVKKGEKVGISTRFESKVNDQIISPIIYLDSFVEGDNKIHSEPLENYSQDGWTRKNIIARNDRKLKQISIRTGDDFGRIKKPSSGIRIRTFDEKRKPIFRNGDYFNVSRGYNNSTGLEMVIRYNDKTIENDYYDLFRQSKDVFYVKNWDFKIDFPLIPGLNNTSVICNLKLKMNRKNTAININLFNRKSIHRIQDAIDEALEWEERELKEGSLESEGPKELSVEWNDERLQAIPEFTLEILQKIKKKNINYRKRNIRKD